MIFYIMTMKTVYMDATLDCLIAEGETRTKYQNPQL